MKSGDGRKAMAGKPAGGSTKSPSSSKSGMGLFDLLKKDHDTVKGLFEQIQGESKKANKETLFSKIEKELEIHMEGEEKYFYPALGESEEAREHVLEAYEEHRVAKTLLEEASGLNKEDERWDAKIKVLCELVDHHIEEEEGELFKVAKDVLDEERRQEIARQIKENKEQMTGL